MARGLQKQQAQAKSRAAAEKKGGTSNLKTRAAAFKTKCPKCFVPMSDYANFTQHWSAKHDKDPLPSEDSLPKA